MLGFGAELGIRTPDSFHYNGFQDRRFRPLSQLRKILNYKQFLNINSKKLAF